VVDTWAQISFTAGGVRCAGCKIKSEVLLQHRADRAWWLWDSQWPATLHDHAGIVPLLVEIV
jgi:hypothetical protein